MIARIRNVGPDARTSEHAERRGPERLGVLLPAVLEQWGIECDPAEGRAGRSRLPILANDVAGSPSFAGAYLPG